MKMAETTANKRQKLQPHLYVLLILWTITMCGMLAWGIVRIQADTRTLASSVARAYLNKDYVFRLWGASHGGVYVPINERTLPDPHLKHVPDRDMETPSGKKLTLINPAYMLRQLQKDFSELFGVKARITSLKGSRPEIAPDEWEEAQLRSFQNGLKEAKEFTEIEGEPHLRLMMPLLAKKSCLKCHGSQGYREGDVQGGVSISLPMESFLDAQRNEMMVLILSYGSICFIGMVAIVLGMRRLAQQEREKDLAIESMKEARDALQEQIRERTLELVTAIEGFKKEIAERQEAEEKLRYSESMLKNILATSPVGIGLARDRGIEWVNEGWKKLFGYETTQDYLNQSVAMLYASQAEFERVGLTLYEGLEDGKVNQADAKLKRKDGTVFEGLVRIAAIDPSDLSKGVIGTVADISDRKRAEQALIQTERLKGVANLASGVAHNFNNILQIVLGNAEFGLLSLQEGNVAEARRDLEAILDRSRFGAKVVRSLQNFTDLLADSDVESEVCDLSLIAEKAVELSRPMWESKPEREGFEIILNTNLSRGCLVECREPELLEVVVSLIRNAEESLPKGGEIQIATWAEDGVVMLRVKDNGIGIPKESLGTVFDPFWTTKGPQFLGMGLASSLGTIRRFGGDLTAESEDGRGAEFTIRLPLADKTVEPTEVPQMPAVDFKFSILVVDDEPLIVSLLDKVLTRSGQAVSSAESGGEAIEVFKEHPVDVVICDLGMPDMDGWEIFRSIRTMCEADDVPKPLFILVTGYGGHTLDKSRIEECGIDEVLDKPIASEKLLAAIAELVRLS